MLSSQKVKVNYYYYYYYYYYYSNNNKTTVKKCAVIIHMRHFYSNFCVTFSGHRNQPVRYKF